MLATVTQGDFEPLRGSSCRAVAGTLDAPLRLVSVRSAGGRAPTALRDPFAVEFEGPPAPRLPQQIYEVTCGPLGTLTLFLVPVGQTKDGFAYEAVFA